ncbi:Fibronectin type III domain-containing protein [Acetitomaculum ruminis DSM 5522]|uniref:Fibronectin type III domain-containing protein n=1 Tax=Acetitomaculum ruminis DSM 5522 TaxID=1120918 RepID=A0A1I0YJ15_9FIRM|nr:fibronectin type III domain-containing protein [Acetitomaculum ruminis]SFB12776.1 Fibronectin type III domain-containing protein [Acetitomaculum ruminis DSM 5522]
MNKNILKKIKSKAALFMAMVLSLTCVPAGVWASEYFELNDGNTEVFLMKYEGWYADYGVTYTYNGDEITPDVMVLYSNSDLTADEDDRELALGEDYDVTYEDNVEVGTATVTVSGIGDYQGDVTSSFEIVAANLSDLDLAYELEKSTYTYTGKAIKPEFEYICYENENGNEIELVEDIDYTLSYKNNTNAGTATVTIKGKGNYTGSKSVSFKITKASLKKASVNLKAVNNNIQVSYKAVTNANNYTIQQYKGKKWSNVTTTSKTSYTIKNANGTVKVRVIANPKNSNYQASTSDSKSVTVLSKVTSVKAKALKGKKINVTFVKNNSASGYEVTYEYQVTKTKKVKGKTKKVKEKVTKTVVIKKNTNSVTLTNLTKGTTYSVKVRSYTTVNKKKVYSAYSSVVKVKASK